MIRFADPADAGRIGEIHVATWRAAYRGIVPDSFLASMSVEEHVARWRGRIEASPKLVFVHEQGGRIDGWTSMGAGRDDDAKIDGEIYALYVESASWRQGVGRALMERAEEELSGRGLNRIVLWVLEQNARARRFYESVGYSPDGRTKEITIGDTVLTELRYEKRKLSRSCPARALEVSYRSEPRTLPRTELVCAEMKEKPSHAQEQSIELLFAAEQQAAARRRKFYARVFVVGLVAAVGTVFTPFFWGYPLTTLPLGLVWFAAVGFYTLGRAIPISYGRDADIRWHVNPWRDALDALASEDRQVQAIALLASFPICRIISKGIAMALR